MPKLVGLEVTILQRTGMTCGICKDREFEQKVHYFAHVVQHGLHMVECRSNGCGLFLKFKSSMESHYTKRHGDGLRVVKCTMRGCAYEGTKHNMSRHVKNVHGQGNIKQCRGCNKMLEASNMWKHKCKA
ncbi:hypothetical protein QAD02_003116 [Eretmocerus hayati]|uniref:Uncharacterized protein n=1 Tax=Eretmocerus hayati TaxID=131215 RepID=A0ACC2NL85_9HYME|nr:hypothetical protein QAD02_003116 [Eretmocerus hayati]